MLSSLLYYIVYAFVFAFSLLPLRILYLFSDLACLLIFQVAGYRRKVVADNLARAFPGKSLAERKAIARTFYRNFTDNFIETIKLASAGEAFIRKHFVIENPELYEQYYEQGKRCQVYLGHVFNWELASLGVCYQTAYPVLVVYMPVKNPVFDRLLRKIRSRTGAVLLPATNMRRSMLPYRDMRYLMALVADQVPGSPEEAYWLNFFGQPAPFMRGPERGARAGHIPVVFAEIRKTNRGYYRALISAGSEDPAALPEGELTRRYVQFLEEAIARNPAMWLWSHRRWKHAWKPDYAKRRIGDTPPEAG